MGADWTPDGGAGLLHKPIRLSPVFNTQARNSSELPDVVRDQPKVEAYGMGRNQQIHRTNRLPLFLKRRP